MTRWGRLKGLSLLELERVSGSIYSRARVGYDLQATHKKIEEVNNEYSDWRPVSRIYNSD